MGLPVSSPALPKGQVRNAPIAQSVGRNVPSRRSGDTFAVFHPHGFLNGLGGLLVA